MAGHRLKVAITHNWLNVRGGSENVLFELCKMFPDAPIYTLVCKADKFPELKGRTVITSWLQKIPVLRFRHEFFPPLRYLIWRFTKLRGYDIVISSSSSENKGVRVSPGTFHLAYIHTPPHYYWRYFHEYLKNPGFGALDPAARIGLRLMNPLLRRLDRKAAQQPHAVLANSRFIQGEIKKYYGRQSTVVYPLVDTDRFSKQKHPRKDYYLVFGRQTVFKRMDLVIEAFKRLGLPLIVAGGGPEHDRLARMSADNVSYETNVSDERLAELVGSARGCVFANEEDFGITWVESMAAGTPVICYGSGGALETVVDGKTGILFERQNVRSLCEAIGRAEKVSWNHDAIKKHALQFSTANFRRNFLRAMEEQYQSFVSASRK